MRHHFKSASLLTSRSVNHGVSAAMAADKGCYANILRYLKSGTIDFVDGSVCAAKHIGDSCDIASIVSNGQCAGLPPSSKNNQVVAVVE